LGQVRLTHAEQRLPGQRTEADAVLVEHKPSTLSITALVPAADVDCMITANGDGQISRYEHGRITPSAEVLIRLVEVFDVTTDYLLLEDAPGVPGESQTKPPSATTASPPSPNSAKKTSASSPASSTAS
jgi:hypothetical protein